MASRLRKKRRERVKGNNNSQNHIYTNQYFKNYTIKASRTHVKIDKSFLIIFFATSTIVHNPFDKIPQRKQKDNTFFQVCFCGCEEEHCDLAIKLHKLVYLYFYTFILSF
ncbi:hypothetical protein L2E82_35505 [Cichorium intybus]|uniref:Uncharacterized protein n=1 Tax=Cichorium intybus TaxID=13427 RepID=A0ACB9BNY3_CICIN|nr:hypothetical protein L2E82_35505 [Cichorium intybus]